MLLISRCGSQVVIKRGHHAGLEGVIVGKTRRGHPKVLLDHPTPRGNTLLEVPKHKLKKLRGGRVTSADTAGSFTSPPMTNDGARPPARRASASIELVVVLPWVPATAIVSRWAAMAASTAAMADMPAPPAPTTWMRIGVRRSIGSLMA